MYYKCVQFHKNPISGLGGVALTRYMDGWTDGQTDGRTDEQGDSYIPPPQILFEGGILILYDHNTYFLSPPVCQTCLIDLYRKMTEQFRPELFDDSVFSEW